MKIQHVNVLNTDYTLMKLGIHKSTPKHATTILQRISGKSRGNMRSGFYPQREKK